MDIEPTFHGYIQNELDALLIFQAAIDGKLKLVPRRPYEIERPYLIVSGNIFVFVEESSGIKRWTDGVTWSPSRISGKFLIYREVDRGYNGAAVMHAIQQGRMVLPPQQQQHHQQAVFGYHQQMSKYTGFVKKTISMKIQDESADKEKTTRSFHIVSYYLEDDVSYHRLQRPSQCVFFNDVKPSPEIIQALDSSMLGGSGGGGKGPTATVLSATKHNSTKHTNDRKSHDDGLNGPLSHTRRGIEQGPGVNHANYPALYTNSGPMGHMPQYAPAAAAMAQVPVPLQMPVSVDSWGMQHQYSTTSAGSNASGTTNGNGNSVGAHADSGMRMPPFPSTAGMYQIPYTLSQQQQQQQQTRNNNGSTGIVMGNSYPLYYPPQQGGGATGSIHPPSGANSTPVGNTGGPVATRNTSTPTPAPAPAPAQTSVGVPPQNYIPKFPTSVNSSTDLTASNSGGNANIADPRSKPGIAPIMYSPANVPQQMYRNSLDSSVPPTSGYPMGMQGMMMGNSSTGGNINSGSPAQTGANGHQPGVYPPMANHGGQPGYHFYGQSQAPPQHSDMMYTHASRDHPRMTLAYGGDSMRGSVYQAEAAPHGGVNTNNGTTGQTEVNVSNGNGSSAGTVVGNGQAPINGNGQAQTVPSRLNNTLTGQTVTDSPFDSNAYAVEKPVNGAAVPSMNGQAFNKD